MTELLWRKQGAAIVSELSFQDGRKGSIVLVGAPQNSKGAAVITTNPQTGQPQTVLLAQVKGVLHPRQLIDILCMQERGFGTRGLAKPDNFNE